MKSLDEIRDELAKAHTAFIGPHADFEQRIFKVGFDAGVAEAQGRAQIETDKLNKQIKIMRDALIEIENGSRLSRYTICGPSYIQLSAAGLQIIAKEALKQAGEV